MPTVEVVESLKSYVNEIVDEYQQGHGPAGGTMEPAVAKGLIHAAIERSLRGSLPALLQVLLARWWRQPLFLRLQWRDGACTRDLLWLIDAVALVGAQQGVPVGVVRWIAARRLEDEHVVYAVFYVRDALEASRLLRKLREAELAVGDGHYNYLGV